MASSSTVLQADEATKTFEYETTRNIQYGEAAGSKLLLDAYVPKGNGPFPAVMVVHGGAWISGSKSQLSFYARALAKRGYACFSINYRLAPKHKSPAQIEDCRTALKWVRTEGKAKHKVDATKVGAIGYSAGGQLVALLGATGKKPEKAGDVDTRLQVVCAGGAPCDFRSTPRNRKSLAFWLGGTRAEKPEAYTNASPLNFVTKDDSPMYLFNGGKDTLVKPNTAQAMHDALKKLNVDTKIHVVENGTHLTTVIDRAALNDAFEFLDKHLRK
jgi:acetyl esterase/lipase